MSPTDTAVSTQPAPLAQPSTPQPAPGAGSPKAPLVRVWRLFKGVLVFLIVVFHLVVLAIRNPLDLWDKPMRKWLKDHGYWQEYGERYRLADNVTWKYTNLVGCEQSWVMFSPPVARRAPFLGVRLEFTDGSSELLKSSEEPNPERYFRVGGWQTRKLEDYLLHPPKDLADNPERPLWEACARDWARRWRKAHPDDPRKLERIVFLRRRIQFPEYDKPHTYDPPTEVDIASFDADGRPLP